MGRVFQRTHKMAKICSSNQMCSRIPHMGMQGYPIVEWMPQNWQRLWQEFWAFRGYGTVRESSQVLWDSEGQIVPSNIWATVVSEIDRGLRKNQGFPGGSVKICLQCMRHRFNPWVWKIPWRRKWQATPVFLLENPMDRGGWQVTVHGVTKE